MPASSARARRKFPRKVSVCCEGTVAEAVARRADLSLVRRRARVVGLPAIAIPNNESVGAVRILVEGRDRRGTVAPGAEYRKVRDGLPAGLCELVDPRTRRKIVGQVTFTQEDFQGSILDRLPNLTVLWEQSFAWDEVASPRIGRLKLRRQDSRSGNHAPIGFLSARGYGERPGSELPRATLYDIAPIVLSAAGIEVPKGMEGHPLFTELAGP